MTDLQPGRELRHRNRRIVAERVGWPAGAVAACERLEREHPGWDVCWFGEWTIKGFEYPAGFYAWRTGTQPGTSNFAGGKQVWVPRRELYGVDVAELEQQLS